MQRLEDGRDPVGPERSPGGYHDDGRPPAIVIGSGFGGLAAAIRLGAQGYRVTVLERMAPDAEALRREARAGHAA